MHGDIHTATGPGLRSAQPVNVKVYSVQCILLLLLLLWCRCDGGKRRPTAAIARPTPCEAAVRDATGIL